MKFHGLWKMLVAIVLICLNVSCSNAKPQDEKTPSVEQILDAYVATTGGIDKYNKICTVVYQINCAILTKGYTFNITEYYARPNKYRLIFHNTEFSSGTDGITCWNKSSEKGIRILTGQEEAEMKRDSAFFNLIYWRNVYESAILSGVETVNGKICYKVELKAKGSRPEIFYFDKKDKLLIKRISELKSLGAVPREEKSETVFGEYQKFGNILLPVKTQVKISELDIIYTYTNIVFNSQIPEDIFKMPENNKSTTLA